MTRTEAAAFLAARFPDYLSAGNRAATDDADPLVKSLRPVIDAALRALGYARADVATAEPDWTGADDDYELQLEYRALLQLARDLGGSLFDVSTGGDSFRLSQLRSAVEKDLATAERALLARFGTTGPVDLVNGTAAVGTFAWDTDFLDDRPVREWCYGD